MATDSQKLSIEKVLAVMDAEESSKSNLQKLKHSDKSIWANALHNKNNNNKQESHKTKNHSPTGMHSNSSGHSNPNHSCSGCGKSGHSNYLNHVLWRIPSAITARNLGIGTKFVGRRKKHSTRKLLLFHSQFLLQIGFQNSLRSSSASYFWSFSQKAQASFSHWYRCRDFNTWRVQLQILVFSYSVKSDKI